MSTTDGFLILDTQKSVTMTETAENPTNPCPRNVVRRKLADISNLPQRPMLLIHDGKSQSTSTTTKEYTEQLQKENMALVKMLAQRNKIIEQSGIELEKLRVNLLKMQEQNQQLALSNTLMLAELNSGKDRLKAFQHELGCKNALLKARKLELEEKERTKSCQNACIEARLAKFQGEGETSKESGDDEKPSRTKRSLQSNCLSSCEQVESKEKAQIKRHFVRRQSARFKAAESKPAEELNEIDDDKFSKHLSPDDPCQNACIEARLAKFHGDGERLKEGGDDEKPGRTKRSLHSNSLCTCEQVESKEKADIKSHFVRRQSARFKAAELKPAEDLDEIDDDKFSKHLSPDDPCQNVCIEGEGETSKEGGEDEKPRRTKRSLQSSSLCSWEQVKSKEKAERQFVRRQSARFKAAELKPAEDLNEIDVAKFSIRTSPDDPCQNACIEASLAKFQGEWETSKEGRYDEKPRRTKRSLQSNRLISCEQVESREKAEIKRPFVRRQSARFKAAESKLADDLNETDDAKFSKLPSPDDPVPEDVSISVNASVKIEDNNCSSGHINDSQQFERLSLCRPSRQAAKKVQSYKEVSLNVKMRRYE